MCPRCPRSPPSRTGPGPGATGRSGPAPTDGHSSAARSATKQPRISPQWACSRALEDALIHSAESAPAAIARPLHTLAGRLRARGADTTAALRAFAAEIDDPVGDLIATALVLAAEIRGPGLHAVLTELASDVA